MGAWPDLGLVVTTTPPWEIPGPGRGSRKESEKRDPTMRAKVGNVGPDVSEMVYFGRPFWCY